MDVDVAEASADELMEVDEAIDWMDIDVAWEISMEVDEIEVSWLICYETCSHLWSNFQNLQDIDMNSSWSYLFLLL